MSTISMAPGVGGGVPSHHAGQRSGAAHSRPKAAARKPARGCSSAPQTIGASVVHCGGWPFFHGGIAAHHDAGGDVRGAARSHEG